MSVVWAGTRRVQTQTITFGFKGVKCTYSKSSPLQLHQLRNVFGVLFRENVMLCTTVVRFETLEPFALR